MAHLDRGAVHPPDRGRARRRRVRAALQPGACRWATRSARTWPRTAGRAARGDVRRRARLPASCRCSSACSARSYLGVPLELSDGTRVGSLAALSRRRDAYTAADEQLFIDARPRARLRARARVQRARPAPVQRPAARPGQGHGRDRPRGQGAGRRRRRPHGDLRGGLRGHGRAGGVPARAVGARVRVDRDVRRDRAAGDDPAARRGAAGGRRSPPRSRTSWPTPATTRRWRAPLVEATSARSAVFQPVLRDGEVAGVLIVIWQRAARRAARRPGARAAAGGRAGGDRHRARRAARPGRRAGADRRADRPGHPARVRGRAAARARPRPPRRHAALRGRARPRPHERVQHAARRARGRPAHQGDRGALAAELREIDVLARLDGVEFAVVLPGLRAERGGRGARPRARARRRAGRRRRRAWRAGTARSRPSC